MEICLALRNALFALGELSELPDILSQAEVFAGTQHGRLSEIISLRAHTSLILGDQNNAILFVDRAIVAADEAGDVGASNLARFFRSQIYASTGQCATAVDDAMAVMASLPKRNDYEDAPSMIVHLCRMWALWCYSELGEFEAATPLLIQSQTIIAAQDNRSSDEVVIAALGCGLFWLRMGYIDPAAIEICIDTLLPAYRLARRDGLDSWVPAIGFPLGYAYVRQVARKKAF
jgi:hypothetical protein